MDVKPSTDTGFGPITLLLRRWNGGDAQALESVWPLIYAELRRLAQRHLRHERQGHTLQGTGLVHEAFLRLSSESKVQWRSRSQFFALASKLMRHILVDHARARAADKRGGSDVVISIDELNERNVELADPAAQPSEAALDILALDQALERLAGLDALQSQVVELRYFGGLSIAETAEALHISPATVKREWVSARAWLLRELRGGTAGAPI